MKTGIRLYNRYLVIMVSVLLGLAIGVQAQTSPKVIKRTLKASPNVDLSVQSKMSDLKIETWDKAEISVYIEIQADAKNQDELKKFYEKFDVKIVEGMGKVSIVAEMPEHKSMTMSGNKTKIEFRDGTKINGLEDLRIEMNLTIPKTAMLSINHKFGDLFLSDISGKVNIYYKHGDLTARNLSGDSYLDLSHVDANITSLGKSFIEAKHSDMDIQKVRHLTLDASYCDISIEDADSLITSQKHNDLSIEKVSYIKMDEKYSEIEINHLMDMGDFDLDFSDFELNGLDKALKKLNIQGELSDFEIDLGDFSDFEVNIDTDFSDVNLPDNISITQDKEDGNHRIVIGTKGDDSNAKIIIITKHGEVIIK